MPEGQKRIEMRRFNLANKHGTDYFLPEDRAKMSGFALK